MISPVMESSIGSLNMNVNISPSSTPEESIKSSIDNVYDILVHVEPAGECQTDEKFGIDKGMVN